MKRIAFYFYLFIILFTARISSFEVVGYLPYYRLRALNTESTLSNWNNFTPALIDPSTQDFKDGKLVFLEYLTTQIIEGRITQLNYFRITPRADGRIDWAGAQPEHLNFLTRLRMLKPFKLTLTIAGGANRFVPMLASEKSRNTFLHELDGIVRRWKLDGLDFDWEFPRNESDLDDYIDLLQSVDQMLPSQSLLSVAIAREQILKKELFNTVDRINLMAYDFSGKHSTLESADEMVSYLSQRYEISADKLLLGIPLYGRIYPISHKNYRKAISYYHLVQRFRPTSNATEINDYYYNNHYTIDRKITLAREKSLAGIMFWELGQDLHDSRSLLRQVLP